MTNEKRELIEILLDNVKPEDWPENLPYAAQDKKNLLYAKREVFFYEEEPVNSAVNKSGWNSKPGTGYSILYCDLDLCKHWNKTIVHRDEFMKRWNERNPSVDSEGWIQWNGGEMPVEKGTLVDVKYRNGKVNLHISAGIPRANNGSMSYHYACDWVSTKSILSIIAYRLHAPQQQKTPQQLALEKFGTDWHDNEGVQPVDDFVLIDAVVDGGAMMRTYTWHTLGLFKIKKWRIHSDKKESQVELAANQLAFDDGPMASEPVRKSPLSTQIGGDHYTKLAIQPMQYSMKNGLDPLQHTIIKYVTRFRDKAGIEDLEKAKHCIDMLIEFEKESK
jgi:hypothetical protein